MSLNDFWLNVRTGARFIAPTAIADSPSIDPGKIESILRGTTVWLTPKSVEGFDPQDFDFLAPAEHQTLTDAVRRFREIAHRVPPNQQASAAEIQLALTQFMRILEILRPEKYADPEALKMGKRIEQRLAAQFPPSVLELRFETGEDASGGSALWIWVVLKDEAAKKGVFSSNVRSVRELLTRTVRELGLERWPYVRFRTAAELKPPAKQTKQ